VKQFQLVIAIILGVTSLGGIAFGLEKYFAKQKDVENIGFRLEQKIIQDKAYNLQQMIWQLEDRYMCHDINQCMNVMPGDVFNNYRWMMEELNFMKKDMMTPTKP